MNGPRLSAFSALAVLALGAISAEAKVLSHFNGNGAFANAYFNSNGAGGYSTINVSQGGTNQAPATYLNYYASNCDTVSGNVICSGTQAYGQIPNKDFTSSSKEATLSTNTASIENFYAVKFTYNLTTGEYSESPISLGYFGLSWKSNGIYSDKFIGTSTKNWLNTTWKSTGQTSSAAASVSGSVGGTPLDVIFGDIGMNSNNDVYMERN